MHKLVTFMHETFKDCESTFKKTSLDDRGGSVENYLCQDDITKVYDFDKYVKETYSPSPLPSSPDAIYVGDKKIYFVEFKNQSLYMVNKKKRNIRKKFKDGTNILKNLLSSYLPSNVEFIFCVVYKTDDKPKHFNPRHIMNSSARFNLDAENKNCDNFYTKIIIQNVDFYKKRFTQLHCD